MLKLSQLNESNSPLQNSLEIIFGFDDFAFDIHMGFGFIELGSLVCIVRKAIRYAHRVANGSQRPNV